MAITVTEPICTADVNGDQGRKDLVGPVTVNERMSTLIVEVRECSISHAYRGVIELKFQHF